MTSKAYKERLRASWMGLFEQAVISKRPDLAGKIDWDTATFMFNRGDYASDAAFKYVESVKDMESL